MKYSMSFEIKGLPKGMNGSHKHWRTAAANRKKWRSISFALAAAKKPPQPLTMCRVKITRFSSAPMDFDNRVASAKPIVDGLVDAGVIKNDDDLCIVERYYNWEKCKPKEGKVLVEVTEL